MKAGRASFWRCVAAASAAATAGYFTCAICFTAVQLLPEVTSAANIGDVAAHFVESIAGGFAIALFGIVYVVGLYYWLIAWFVALAVQALLTRLGVRRRLTTVAIGAMVGAVVGTFLLGGLDSWVLPLHSVAGALSGAAAAAASWSVIHPRTRSDEPRHSASQSPAGPT